MQMSSEEEQVRRLINSFFQAGGVNQYKGPINNAVAAVFTRMLLEAQGCLNDHSWAFRPDPDSTPIEALLSQINTRIIEKLARLNQESTCIEFAIEKHLDRLKQAIVSGK